jgi:hypothetical protein
VVSDATRFGYTAERWERAVDAGVKTCIAVASDRTTISYTDLCRRIFDYSGVEIVPGEFALRALLGDISEVTLDSDGIAITALVTYQGTTEPGDGFFALGVEHGLLPKKPTPGQRDEFRVRQVAAAYARSELVKPFETQRYGAF